MIRKISIFAVISIMIFQGAAFAIETEGEIIFRDSLYGAAIGGLLGAAIYAMDSNNLGEKIGGGVLVGTLGGLVYGLSETRSFAEIEDGEVKFAVPTPKIQKINGGTQYSASLLTAKF